MGQATVPAGLTQVIAIAAGGSHSLALKQDGTVIAWGYNSDSQATVPDGLTQVIAIAAGGSHSLALKEDGTVIAWGRNRWGQATVPAGLTGVTAIAAGEIHSLALRESGGVIAWGHNDSLYGEAHVPVSLPPVTAIGAGGTWSLAIVRDALGVVTALAPSIASLSESKVIPVGQSPSFTVTVRGTPPFTYQWLRNGAPVADATSATITLANAQPAEAGSYTVQVTGPGGTVTSPPTTLSFVTDANSNGLPDMWETVHALALNNPDNASADPDHDGASNWQEYLAGTDPQIANSVFHVTTARIAASGFQITFSSVTGKTYRIEWASDPSGPWTVLENNLPGSNAPIQITDTASPASATRFYRVVAL